MSKSISRADIADFTAFSSALSLGTAQMKELSNRFAVLSTVSDTLASKLGKLSSNAASMMSFCQTITTYCQCKETHSSKTESGSWQHPETTDQLFVLSTAVLAGVKLWAEATKWLWRAVFKPVATALMDRALIPMWRVVVASEALAAVTETAVEFAAALATLASSPAILLAATAALVAAAAYAVRRKWSVIVRIIGELTAAVSRETNAIVGKLTSVVVGLENGTTQDFEPAGRATSRERLSRGLRASASAAVVSFAHNVFPVALQSLRAVEPWQIWDGFQPERLSARRAVAMARLTAPLLVAPTMANISSDRSTTRESSVSMIFNSTPTIVINGCQSDGIEHRIEEALRQHREAIYLEWSRELQRRQRTEL
jgi:hypothetical protein